MRALISGGTGFVGTHLAEFLAGEGLEVCVFARETAPPSQEGFRCFQVDIRDEEGVQRVVQEVQPSEIYHLAAISSVPVSWQDPRQTFDVNVTGAYILFEACRRLPNPPSILNVSSGQVYGSPKGDSVVWREDSPLRPGTPYASSKAMAELLACQYVEAYGLRIVTARSFNHIGPGQSRDFVLSDFAYQFAVTEAGRCPPILRIGNLDVERDFTDIRDATRAYRLLLQHGTAGQAYNVCSGRARSLSEAIATLEKLTSIKMQIELDSQKIRSKDVRSICGDPARTRAATGWRPEVPLDTSLATMLQFWRDQVQAPANPTVTRVE